MRRFASWATCFALICVAPAAAQDGQSVSEQAGSVAGSTLGNNAATAAGGPVAGAVGGVVGSAVGKTTGKVVNSVLPWNWGKKKKKQAEEQRAAAADQQGAPVSAEAPAAPESQRLADPEPVRIDLPPPSE